MEKVQKVVIMGGNGFLIKKRAKNKIKSNLFVVSY
jgi:hypothetical protein